MHDCRFAQGALVLAIAIASTACASYPRTARLQGYDLARGYRFEQLPPATPQQSDPDELFVILAFSGGGTRAAAFSYGVLAQLAAITLPGGRSLLDEVDVISSVSGGSFTAAYYALHGERIFEPGGLFHSAFLHYPVQRDLVAEAVYRPANWRRLRSRVEIAANLYGRALFGDATFAALEKRPRPYVILNATDASRGTRFEFTQEQFDLLCADLSAFPIRRAVAASSAFPGLLNSMTIDSYNTEGCGYRGPGTQPDDWVALALRDGFTNYRRYNAARETLAYRDPARRHLHLLDGGLADNIGLRGVLQSLVSTDRPQDVDAQGNLVLGGWSVLSKINNAQVKTIVVITVNARTNRAKDWDTKQAGPSTFSVINASSGIPMGSFSTETLELLREYGPEAEFDDPDSPRFYGVEVAFENLADEQERTFFANLGTNFDLARFEVDCLIDRGAQLLRESSSVTEVQTQSFQSFVTDHLQGTIGMPIVPQQPACTPDAARTAITRRHHYVDVGLQYRVARASSDDVDHDHGLGLAVRVTKPNGFGATIGYGAESFDLIERSAVGAQGTVRLRAISGGLLFSRHFGPIEATASMSVGYGFGSFSLADSSRDRLAQAGNIGLEPSASNAWLFKPGVAIWHDVTSRLAATVSASYISSRPTVRLAPGEAGHKVRAEAVRIAAGLGVKVF